MQDLTRSQGHCSITAIVSIALAAAFAPAATSGAEGYRLPAQQIVDLVDTPPTPGASLSPDGTAMLLVQSASLPTIAELAEPMLRLAGLRIPPEQVRDRMEDEMNRHALEEVRRAKLSGPLGPSGG